MCEPTNSPVAAASSPCGLRAYNSGHNTTLCSTPHLHFIYDKKPLPFSPACWICDNSAPLRTVGVDDFVKDMLVREAMNSTDAGVAIPHARSRSLVSFLRLNNIVDEIRYIFLIGAKDGEERGYMKMLTQIARALLVESFVEKLEIIRDEEEFKRELEQAIKKVED